MAVNHGVGIDWDDAARLEERGFRQPFTQDRARGVGINAKRLIVAVPADESDELVRAQFALLDDDLLFRALAEELAVQVFASAVLARHAFVPHRVHTGVNRQRIIGDKLWTSRKAAREFQRGENAVWLVAMHTGHETDRHLHRIRGKRWKADDFQEFVVAPFEAQLSDSLNVKYVFPQRVDGFDEGAVSFFS